MIKKPGLSMMKMVMLWIVIPLPPSVLMMERGMMNNGIHKQPFGILCKTFP